MVQNFGSNNSNTYCRELDLSDNPIILVQSNAFRK